MQLEAAFSKHGSGDFLKCCDERTDGKLVFRGAAVENFTHERLIFLLSSIGYIAGKLSRSGAMLVELVVFNSLLELDILLLATFE